jgi:hypothetical protein
MEPVTMLVSALAAGAAAGLKPTAAKAVKDAYGFLKGVLSRKFSQIELKPLESKPDSVAKQESLKEDLAGSEAPKDPEVLDAIRKLLDAIAAHEPGAGIDVGVDLDGVKAASLSIGNITSSGTGAKLRNSEFSGDIKIGDVNAGGSNGSNGPSPHPR